MKIILAGWILGCLLGGGMAQAEEEAQLVRCEAKVPTSSLSLEIRRKQMGSAESPGPFRQELLEKGFQPGKPVLLRSYKGTLQDPQGVLEVWIQKEKGWTRAKPQFVLFKRYPILAWGGGLGPKLKEGDGQSPEGFYSIESDQLNPYSLYHLSMDVGFPNRFDQSLGRTGGGIMIHGSNESVGCFAIGDPSIEEIYTLVEAAFLQCVPSVPFISLPFVMSTKNLDSAHSSPWFSFWENLAEGDRIFEEKRLAPKVEVGQGRYLFRSPWLLDLFSIEQ